MLVGICSVPPLVFVAVGYRVSWKRSSTEEGRVGGERMQRELTSVKKTW